MDTTKKDERPSEVVQWIDPEAYNFEPTDRQKAFRRHVRHCVTNGIFLKSRWYTECLKSQSEKLKKHPVNTKDWRQWVKKAGFLAWFYEEFPEVDPISDQELRMMDNKWWDGVLQAMHEGEEWAYKIFARVRFHNAEVAQAKAETKELQDYLGRDSAGGAWRLPSAEA